MSGQGNDGSTLLVRFEIHAGREVAEPGIRWIRGKENLDDCQRAYIEARDTAGLGCSQFGSADVFTDKGQHIAHISYNGALLHKWVRDSLFESSVIAGRDEQLVTHEL